MPDAKSFKQLRSRLEKVMESEVTNSTINELKKLINYDRENGFYNLTILKSYINNNTTYDNDSDASYCLAILNDIQTFLEVNSLNTVPIKDRNGNKIKLMDMIEHLSSNKPNSTKAVLTEQIKERLVKKPLRWGNISITDYFEIDPDTMEVYRKYVL